MRWILVLVLWLSLACTKESVTNGTLDSAVPSVSKIDKLQLISGDTLNFEGSNLKEDFVITIDDVEVPFETANPSQGSLVVPAGARRGTSTIVFSSKGNVFASFPILLNTRVDEGEIITYSADQICSDTLFKATNGVIAQGLRNCGSLAQASAYAQLLPENVKRGVVIGSVIGTYPSAGVPLEGASSSVSDLISLGSATAVGAYEFFDSAGKRYTGSIADGGTVVPGISAQTVAATNTVYRQVTVAGDSNLASLNIKDTIIIFGITGSLVAGSNCTADGQTGCLTTSTYKSADTSAITAWDIRAGKTAGGISGNLTFFKNMAKLTTFNRTTGTAAGASSTVADIYDSIDDFNSNSTMPSDIPPGFGAAPGSNWLRDSLSDTGVGGGTASNGICDGTEACVYKDQTTGLLWAKDNGTTYTWENAITQCDGLAYGGYNSGWRLPTQKELYQSYIDGIWGQRTNLALSNSDYWSSSTHSSNTISGWIVDLDSGNVYNNGKTIAYNVACTR